MNQKSIIADKKHDATCCALHNTLFVFRFGPAKEFNFRLKPLKLLWIINIIFNWKRYSGSQKHHYARLLRQGRIRHE